MTTTEFESKINSLNAEHKAKWGRNKIFRNSMGYKIALEMIKNPTAKIHPDRSNRRWKTYYAHDAVYILSLCGIKAYVSNDAPKGGAIGNFVVIL